MTNKYTILCKNEYKMRQVTFTDLIFIGNFEFFILDFFLKCTFMKPSKDKWNGNLPLRVGEFEAFF